MAQTLTFGSIDDAREYARKKGGRYYLVSSESLEHIRAAEEAGGFEGGMSGDAGGAGYSAEGSYPSSSLPELPMIPFEYWETVAIIEGAYEKLCDYADLKDLVGALSGETLGPLLVVPKRELERMRTGNYSGNDGA
jgi:hypothetical protein